MPRFPFLTIDYIEIPSEVKTSLQESARSLFDKPFLPKYLDFSRTFPVYFLGFSFRIVVGHVVTHFCTKRFWYKLDVLQLMDFSL